MKITREQFIRGFRAVQAQHVFEDAQEALATQHGNRDFTAGSSPLTAELIRQLEERCGDRRDEHGLAWPSGEGLGDIEYALYEGGDAEQGDVKIKLDGAEALWEWWSQTRSGPFKPDEVNA